MNSWDSNSGGDGSESEDDGSKKSEDEVKSADGNDESDDPEVFYPDEYFVNTQDPFSGYLSD